MFSSLNIKPLSQKGKVQAIWYNQPKMYIKVRVIAGAREDKIEKIKETEFKLWVKAKAERNMANKRVIELVAAYLGVPTSKVLIINGHASPSKLLSIRD